MVILLIRVRWVIGAKRFSGILAISEHPLARRTPWLSWDNPSALARGWSRRPLDAVEVSSVGIRGLASINRTSWWLDRTVGWDTCPWRKVTTETASLTYKQGELFLRGT